MKRILVIGSSGFVGGNLAKALLAEGYAVRCLARKPEKVQDLAVAGCEIIQGDISDAASITSALKDMDAVYISIHTLSTQHADTANKDFMDVEIAGLQNIISACQSNGVKRLVYVTFLGASPDSPSAWIRGRWNAEQFLLKSGLDVTVIRPGMIVGIGGQGFGMALSNAKKRLAIVIGTGEQKFRCIAIDDLCYYLIGVLDEPKAYGQCFDVGNDDVLSNNRIINTVADILGRSHPAKLHIPKGLLAMAAPLIQRIGKLPKGAMKGMVDSIQSEAIGDPSPIRAILTRKPLSLKQAVEQVLALSAK